jgi:alpha-tubulin suppressor-like RCC1 family protein
MNEEGQLGNGTTSNSGVPVEVNGLTGVSAVSGGRYHSLALKGTEKGTEKGTVWAWGGSAGFNSHVPVRVPELSNVAAISAGGIHSLALLNNGEVKAWGFGEYTGSLGDGAFNDSNVPVSVKGLKEGNLTEVTAVAGGLTHSLALLRNGTVVAWGANEKGELGNGTITNSDVPVEVKGLSEVAAIAAGVEDSIALLRNGAVMAWGTITRTPVPAVVGLSEVTAIAAGGEHSLALHRNGTVQNWGFEEGGLGNLTGLTQVDEIAAGLMHSLASGVQTP